MPEKSNRVQFDYKTRSISDTKTFTAVLYVLQRESEPRALSTAKILRSWTNWVTNLGSEVF
jgi:hypothetical protein